MSEKESFIKRLFVRNRLIQLILEQIAKADTPEKLTALLKLEKKQRKKARERRDWFKDVLMKIMLYSQTIYIIVSIVSLLTQFQ